MGHFFHVDTSRNKCIALASANWLNSPDSFNLPMQPERELHYTAFQTICPLWSLQEPSINGSILGHQMRFHHRVVLCFGHEAWFVVLFLFVCREWSHWHTAGVPGHFALLGSSESKTNLGDYVSTLQTETPCKWKHLGFQVNQMKANCGLYYSAVGTEKSIFSMFVGASHCACFAFTWYCSWSMYGTAAAKGGIT